MTFSHQIYVENTEILLKNQRVNKTIYYFTKFGQQCPTAPLNKGGRPSSQKTEVVMQT